MTRDILADVASAWSRGKGALLYGPPATGKTRLISQLYKAVQNENEEVAAGVVLDPDNVELPLDHASRRLPIPRPAKVIWTTFHQSYTYEDFLVGLTPDLARGEFALAPRLGVLLDGLYELLRPTPTYRSVVLLIDELNRGNAARIFGEFLTFLDFEYRDTDSTGAPNELRLPMPLRQVRHEGGETEPVLRSGGESVRLPWPVYFPRHLYVVGTMNSVDRAAVPLDSALARRFERIEMRPELTILADHFNLDLAELANKATGLRSEDAGDGWTGLTAYETAVLLLDRVNTFISGELGPEFELGHGLLMPASSDDEDGRWARLASVWDDVVFPQVEDRFAGRPEQLLELLKVDEPPDDEYAWKLRTALGHWTHGRSLDPVRLAAKSPAVRSRSLQWLAI